MEARALDRTTVSGAKPRAARPALGRMGRWPRAMVAVASLLILLVFAFPIWRYDLDAPQYPEGISMTIWVNGIGGRLDLVNSLNHYIGMKHIEPDSFPELRLMPWVIILLCAAGLAVAVAGRVRGLAIWVGGFALFGVVGLADFYRWLYEFGHDLSPDAPIQVDPFTPPLVGPKQVMNFEVITYPDVGGAALIVALLLGMAALVMEVRARRRQAVA